MASLHLDGFTSQYINKMIIPPLKTTVVNQPHYFHPLAFYYKPQRSPFLSAACCVLL